MVQHKQAFTLIELLVVVLIIGILAAVAVPQYQKAVWKSRSTELVVTARAIANAQEIYWLANGNYPMSFDELDLTLEAPSAGSNCSVSGTIKHNERYEFALSWGNDWTNSLALFNDGDYKCAGYLFVHQKPQNSILPEKAMYCVEHNSVNPTGKFCEKVLHATYITDAWNWGKVYRLP
ncbi:MAG: type II secretion system protein [Elusimicrobiaceae bacterium]|nr:type II secretion system protein [Elusimicrobiaceae bacterium]